MRSPVEDRLTEVEEKQAEQIARMRAIAEFKEYPWCFVKEASEILGKSPITLQRWRSSGFGPAWHKNGSRIVYRRTDLYDWMLGQGDNEATQAPSSPINTSKSNWWEENGK